MDWLLVISYLLVFTAGYIAGMQATAGWICRKYPLAGMLIKLSIAIEEEAKKSK